LTYVLELMIMAGFIGTSIVSTVEILHITYS